MSAKRESDAYSESVSSRLHRWLCCRRPETHEHLLRRQPAQYYLLRNVLVRQGTLVLFTPPANEVAASEKPAGAGPTTLHMFQNGRIGGGVNVSYDPAPTSGADPFASCASASFGQGSPLRGHAEVDHQLYVVNPCCHTLSMTQHARADDPRSPRADLRLGPPAP